MKAKTSVLLVFSLCFLMSSYAQVQVFLHQPPPGQLNIGNLWQFEIINNTEANRYVKFYATVNSDREGLVFEGTSSAYELSAMFTGLVSFPELEPFNMSYINEGIKEILLRTGTVPSGVYLVCLEVIDVESAESLFRDCIDQEVIQASPPVLVYPIDGSTLEEEMPVFSWMEPVPPVDGMLYKIQISEILANQSPEQALITSPAYFAYSGIMGNLFEYPLSARPLEVGKSYAWRVTGTIIGRDLLESEYSTFIRLDPSGNPADIELTFPSDGELIDPKKTVFCWKPVLGEGIVYNVIVSKGECDTVSASDNPHPFGYLSPDTGARKPDSLRRAIERYDIPFWRAFCERLRENIEIAQQNRSILEDQQRQFEEWAREIGCELTEPDCDLPDCCPEGGCCADLDPSDPADRAEYRRRLNCLIGAMRSTNSTLNEFAEDFEWLINRWRSGEDHRNTMGAYDDIFRAYEYIFSLQWMEDLQQEIFDALGITEMMEDIRNFVLNEICSGMEYSDEECRRFIEKLNEIEQLLNDVQEGKEDIETAIATFKALLSGGELPIDVFLKLVENLSATAAEATGVGVEGWENFWREMCSTLKRAYRLNRCIQELNEQIAQLEENCPEFCLEVQAQLEEEASRATAEYDRLREERHDRWLADSTAFSNDLDNSIREFTDNLGRSGICCQPPASGMVVYTFPPYGSDDPCKEYLFDLLSQSLGDRLCYFNIRIEINCETLEVNYTWETTEGFQRNEDCCPRVPVEETVGRTEGNPGEDEVCWPPGGDEADPGREGIDTGGGGRWRVEAEREGRVVGRSSSRGFQTRPGRGESPPPDTIRIPRVPGAVCNCQVKISINGFTLPGGVGMIIETGTSLNIKMEGECTGTCTSGKQNLSVEQPALIFTGMSWIFPPFVANGNRMRYEFKTAGTYKVVAKQQCSDGSECEIVAIIEVKDPAKSAKKPKSDATINFAGRKCGNSKCIHPYYFIGQDRFIIPGNEIELDKAGKNTIGYLSECFPNCYDDKNIEWQIREPSGKEEIISGSNMFEIDYNFDQTGTYSICIIENAKCPNSIRQDSKFLEVRVVK